MDFKQYFIFQLKLKAWVKKLLCSLVASVSLTRRQQAEQIIAWGRTSSNTATQYSRGSAVRGSRRCVRLLGITCQTQSNGKHKKNLKAAVRSLFLLLLLLLLTLHLTWYEQPMQQSQSGMSLSKQLFSLSAEAEHSPSAPARQTNTFIIFRNLSFIMLQQKRVKSSKLSAEVQLTLTQTWPSLNSVTMPPVNSRTFTAFV